jgi:hypothetical protein
MDICSKCGNPINAGDKFCQTCGQSVGATNQPPVMTNATPTPQQASGPRRSKKGIALVGGIVVVVIIAALLLAGPLLSGITNGHPTGQIYNGSYLKFSISGMIDGQSRIGSVTLTFNNVTSTSFSLKESGTTNGQANVEYSSNYQMTNGDWTTVFKQGSSSSGSLLMGQETLQTNYGQKITNHYVFTTNYGNLGLWKDVNNPMVYQIQNSYSNGESVIWELTDTNMM